MAVFSRFYVVLATSGNHELQTTNLRVGSSNLSERATFPFLSNNLGVRARQLPGFCQAYVLASGADSRKIIRGPGRPAADASDTP